MKPVITKIRMLMMNWLSASHVDTNGKNIAFYILLSVVSLIGVAILDWRLSHRISVMPFYLIPIILSSALVSRSAGAWMSVVCATVWFLVDVGAGSVDYRHAISPYWNALVRLFFFLMVVGVISLNKSLQKEKSRARVDSLTGILNRRAFYELSRQEMARSRRYHRPLSLVFFDLNGFKQVNDRYGHRTGDRILRSVGASIRKNIREGDIAARWGGDEFAVFLPETDYKGATRFVNRLNKALIHIAEQEVKGVKASFGIKTYAIAPVSVDEMVKAADELMYSAKRAGLLHKA